MTELTVAPAPTPPARTSRTAPELLVPSVLGGNKGTVCAGETRARSAAGGRGRRVYPRTVSAGGTGRPGAFGGRGTLSSESPAVQAGRAAGRRGAGGGRGTPGRGRGLGGVATGGGVAQARGPRGRRARATLPAPRGPAAAHGGGASTARARRVGFSFSFFFYLVKQPREPPPIHLCANRAARTDPERGHAAAPLPHVPCVT